MTCKKGQPCIFPILPLQYFDVTRYEFLICPYSFNNSDYLMFQLFTIIFLLPLLSVKISVINNGYRYRTKGTFITSGIGREFEHASDGLIEIVINLIRCTL